MNINIHPWAREDLWRQIQYLEKAQVDLQVFADFDAAIREALDQIAANPTTWSFARGSTKIRKVQIPRFRMQAFYGIPSNGIPLVMEFASPGIQPRWAGRLRRIDPIT